MMYKLDNNGCLDVRHMKLTSLFELPDGIRVLDCSDNKLEYLPELPESLVELYCNNNVITFLPELPNSLKLLDICDNYVSILPEFGDNLNCLFCYNNPLECLIPTRYLSYQSNVWLYNYYYPYIGSYKGQMNILSKDVSNIIELMKQVKIDKNIREEFSYLIESCELNLI